MRNWRASVQTKLTLVTMATCVFAMVLAGAGIIAFELITSRSELVRQLVGVADLIGASSTAAVQFRDIPAGTEALAVFRGDTDVQAARIDLADGTPFASYGAEASVIPDRLPVVASVDISRTVVVSRSITLDGRHIGAIRVQGNLDQAYVRIQRFALILVLVLVVSSLLAFLLSRGLQRVISGPIFRLAGTASRVAAEHDYSLRAVRETEDELGLLVDRFNGMLAQIEEGNAALQDARTDLERRVIERTRTLEIEILGHRRTENELLLAKIAAEEASIAKSAFVANMSHELRTPLNAIIGFGELLEEEALEQGAAGTLADLGKITAAGQHLLSLINSVLDLSKIEAGRMDLQIETVEVGPLVEDVVATSRTLAATRGNRLTVSGIDLLGTMQTDGTKLRQVLLNLVGNACKFTHDGEVHVAARREPGDPADWIVLSVTDTGVGLTPEQTSRLFRDFTQADPSITRRYGGTGLGLAISQRLCRAMGGVITVESESGRGATFTVRLPVEPVGSALGSGVELAMSPVAGLGGVPDAVSAAGLPLRDTVMVVEDDRRTRDLTVRLLEKAGFHTVTASSAMEGLRVARETAPQAVVLDVVMPGATGWNLLEVMKAEPVLRDIPVVVLSIVQDRARSLQAGAVEHLLKPVNADLLIATVRRVTGEGRRGGPPAQATPADASMKVLA